MTVRVQAKRAPVGHFEFVLELPALDSVPAAAAGFDTSTPDPHPHRNLGRKLLPGKTFPHPCGETLCFQRLDAIAHTSLGGQHGPCRDITRPEAAMRLCDTPLWPRDGSWGRSKRFPGGSARLPPMSYLPHESPDRPAPGVLGEVPGRSCCGRTRRSSDRLVPPPLTAHHRPGRRPLRRHGAGARACDRSARHLAAGAGRRHDDAAADVESGVSGEEPPR